MPSSRARKQPSIGPAPPNGIKVKSRGSTAKRAISLLTSTNISEIATWTIASAVSGMLRPSAAASGATAASASVRLVDSAL
jgi:hypothetical protein